MSDIGKKMYERRKELGLTLEEVGKAVGVGKSTVRKWENGIIKNMGRDKIAALAKVLQMDPVDFVPGNDTTMKRIDVSKQPPKRLFAMDAMPITETGKRVKLMYSTEVMPRGITKVEYVPGINEEVDRQLDSMIKLWKISSPKAKTMALEILKVMNEKED